MEHRWSTSTDQGRLWFLLPSSPKRNEGKIGEEGGGREVVTEMDGGQGKVGESRGTQGGEGRQGRGDTIGEACMAGR